MKSKILSTVLIAASFLFCEASSAQPEPNDNEAQVSASFFRPIGSGGGAFNGDFIYGKYLDDPRFQYGLRQSFTYNYNDEGEDVWNAVTAPFFNYHFLDVMQRKEFVPYVGALAGAVWNEDDLTGTVGPQGGIKMYLSPSTFLSANYRYEWFFEELRDANEVQDSNHVVTLGLGYNWD